MECLIIVVGNKSGLSSACFLALGFLQNCASCALFLRTHLTVGIQICNRAQTFQRRGRHAEPALLVEKEGREHDKSSGQQDSNDDVAGSGEHDIKYEELTAEGVPEMAPVEESRESPAGSEGETDQVVMVPPLEVGVTVVMAVPFVKVKEFGL